MVLMGKRAMPTRASWHSRLTRKTLMVISGMRRSNRVEAKDMAAEEVALGPRPLSCATMSSKVKGMGVWLKHTSLASPDPGMKMGQLITVEWAKHHLSYNIIQFYTM